MKKIVLSTAIALPLWAVLVPWMESAMAQSEPNPGQEESLVLPARDPELQAALDTVLAQKPYRGLIASKRLSVMLVDLSQPGAMRTAWADADRMRYAASLPKIAVLLAVFQRIREGEIEYTPELRKTMVAMIRKSSNRAASQLIRLVGFSGIAKVLRDPRYELYDPDRKGGLWVGKGYGGLGYWRRDPLHNLSHGATARQVARFFVMMERGLLIDAWSSAEIKAILGQPAIKHKFVKGLEDRPGSTIYRKSGTWRDWHSDAALVERDGKKYVAVVLMESSTKGVLAGLIVKLDDIVFTGQSD